METAAEAIRSVTPCRYAGKVVILPQIRNLPLRPELTDQLPDRVGFPGHPIEFIWRIILDHVGHHDKHFASRIAIEQLLGQEHRAEDVRIGAGIGSRKDVLHFGLQLLAGLGDFLLSRLDLLVVLQYVVDPAVELRCRRQCGFGERPKRRECLVVDRCDENPIARSERWEDVPLELAAISGALRALNAPREIDEDYDRHAGR